MHDIGQQDLIESHVRKLRAQIDDVAAHLGTGGIDPAAVAVSVGIPVRCMQRGDGVALGHEAVHAAAEFAYEPNVLVGLLHRFHDGRQILRSVDLISVGFPYGALVGQLAGTGFQLQHQSIALGHSVRHFHNMIHADAGVIDIHRFHGIQIIPGGGGDGRGIRLLHHDLLLAGIPQILRGLGVLLQDGKFHFDPILGIDDIFLQPVKQERRNGQKDHQSNEGDGHPLDPFAAQPFSAIQVTVK